MRAIFKALVCWRTLLVKILLNFVLVAAVVSFVWSQPAASSAREKLTARGLAFSDETFAKYVAQGDREVVDLFLEAGASPNSLSSEGEPLIVLATREGHAEIVERLLSAGAHLEPLVKAVDSKPDWKAVSQLITALSGVLIALAGLVFTHLYNQRGKRLQELETVSKLITPLVGDEDERSAALVSIAHLANQRLAASLAGLKADKGAAVACIELLRGGQLRDLRALDRPLRHVFLQASKNGRKRIVQLLQGQLPREDWAKLLDATDEKGRTGAMLAARNKHTDILDLLIEEGADLKVADLDDETALHLAAKHRRLEPVKRILQSVAEWNTRERQEYLSAKDKKGRTALDRAKEKDTKEIYEEIEAATNEN